MTAPAHYVEFGGGRGGKSAGGALGTVLSLAPLGSDDYAHFQLTKLERRDHRQPDDVTCLDSPHTAMLLRASQPRYRIEGLLNGPRAWALAHCIDLDLPCSYKITMLDGVALTGTCYVTRASVDPRSGTFDLELLVTKEVLPITEVSRLSIDGKEIPKESFAVIHPRRRLLPAAPQPAIATVEDLPTVEDFGTVEDLPTAADFALSFEA